MKTAKKECCLAIFQTTHETLKAEDIFLKNSIPVKPVIRPRSIKTDCGMALEFEKSLKDKIKKLCYSNKLNLIKITLKGEVS